MHAGQDFQPLLQLAPPSTLLLATATGLGAVELRPAENTGSGECLAEVCSESLHSFVMLCHAAAVCHVRSLRNRNSWAHVVAGTSRAVLWEIPRRLPPPCVQG